MRKLAQLAVFWGSNMVSAVRPQPVPKPTIHSAYDFTFESIDNEELALDRFRGKALLVVNTASKCGFTPQYKGLEALYEKYAQQGLVIIAVPSNDFGGQEPGSATDIKAVCRNYGVTFPVARKYAVTGDNAHPFYKWVSETLGFGSAPKWNFHKFLVDPEGRPVRFFGSTTAPESQVLIEAIESVLPRK